MSLTQINAMSQAWASHLRTPSTELGELLLKGTINKADVSGGRFVAFLPLDIHKGDEEHRIVHGYASHTSKDNQGESVTKGAMEDALPSYMEFGNLREMHSSSAVGVVESAHVDDSGIYITAKVVDDSAWKKVQEGVYKGFSIGGKSLEKTNGVIKKMRLTEISLVDRPANTQCRINTSAA